MTDLAERLRAYRAGDDPGVAVEAADEIERLRAELAALQQEKVKA